MHDKLRTRLAAKVVAREMFRLNALTLDELESVVVRGEESEAADQLLETVKGEAERDVYECFLDVLRTTNQLDIYSRIVYHSGRLLQHSMASGINI